MRLLGVDMDDKDNVSGQDVWSIFTGLQSILGSPKPGWNLLQVAAAPLRVGPQELSNSGTTCCLLFTLQGAVGCTLSYDSLGLSRFPVCFVCLLIAYYEGTSIFR